jgi:hypothetical protein
MFADSPESGASTPSGVIFLNMSSLAKSWLLPQFALGAVAQALQRSHGVRAVAFDYFGGFHSACEARLRHAANCKIVYREQASSLNAVVGKTR